MSNVPASRENYPYVTRSLLRLYEAGSLENVADIDLEPEYGYVARISYQNGSHRITFGNDLGLNTAASNELAKDKGHTKFMLRAIGIDCPKGGEFLLPTWAERIRASQATRGNVDLKTSDMADAYVQSELRYPVYTKPVDGSKGGDVFKVHTSEELDEVMCIYDEKKVKVAIVEEPINMPDYRVVVLDGELISAYRRMPLAVTGNGQATIRDLLSDLQTKYEDEGRDTRIDPNDYRIATHLAKIGLDLQSVPDKDYYQELVPVSNLSAGGTSEDVTESLHARWSELASYIAKNFNLRLCGVDLACSDITSPDATYSVLEVNAAPGLDHYAASGDVQRQLVDRLYARVFNALPS